MKAADNQSSVGRDRMEVEGTGSTTGSVQAASGQNQVADAVGHLSDYYRHLTTVSAGAIVVIGAFARDLGSPGSAGVLARVAIASLGVCIVVSTFMMWAYGVARRETDSKGLTPEAAWAYQVSKPSAWLARVVLQVGSLIGPIAFAGGFGLLALYAANLL